MKTRQCFANWLDRQKTETAYSINLPRFYNYNENDYVFEVLHTLPDLYPALTEYIADFQNLEKQRYAILNQELNIESVKQQYKQAMDFCKKSIPEKRSSNFSVNPRMTNFLVQSDFLWRDASGISSEKGTNSYLFIPSFLDLAPKEVFLVDLNAVLLDIMEYSEEFSYKEFFSLVQDNLEIEESALDAILLEFMANQVLYYGTFLPSS